MEESQWEFDQRLAFMLGDRSLLPSPADFPQEEDLETSVRAVADDTLVGLESDIDALRQQGRDALAAPALHEALTHLRRARSVLAPISALQPEDYIFGCLTESWDAQIIAIEELTKPSSAVA